jgi:two-component system sensor histidine kinase ChiS
MKPTILCVDDERIVLDSLKDQLKRSFSGEARVEVAESAEAALEIIDELLEENAEIPVIITDQIMPGVKGDELLIRLHERLPRTLKILLTGQASAEAVGNAVNRANLYRYVAKPWEREDLNLTVREAIRSYFRDKQLDEQNEELRALASDLEKKNLAFFRFVPKDYLRLLGIREDFERVNLGMGVDLDMSVLFADIRDFTPVCEGLSPAECVEFINSYLVHIEQPIYSNQGFIHEFFGDGTMALFDQGASGALRAGIGMSRSVAKFSSERQKAGKPVVRIGVGVNAGPVTIGTVGVATRMTCGVAGDTVNLASRVESLTKTYKVSMLVSHNVVERIDDSAEFALRQVDRVMVKGRYTPVDLFEVIDAEPPETAELKRATLACYSEAIGHFYASEFIEAGCRFAQCLVSNPRDLNALNYLARCRQCMDGVPSGWTGVEALDHK